VTEQARNRRGSAVATRRGSGGHLKRYGPFYAIGLVAAIAIAVVPSIGGDDDAGSVATSTTTAPAPGEWAPASGDLEAGTGTTRGGAKCAPGVAQIPDTIYALPCVAAFTGDNGGASYQGVSADTIRVVYRKFPATANSEAVDEGLHDAGLATLDEAFEIEKKFIDYFNDQYELYGRRVEVIEYESEFGNSTSETLGQGREGACQDATKIVEELHAFAVISESSQVFSECAAERGLVVLSGGAYSSDEWYQELHPYVWHLTMSCTPISDHVAEYLGKRLGQAGNTAEFAGGDLRGRPRRFGTYIPDIETYLQCNDRTVKLLEETYKVSDASSERITYALDISRFAEQAQRAVLQFKADGVTSVVLAADPFSIQFMTAAAREQDYFPEWITIGSAAADTDSFGRSYDSESVDGHLFGVSQLPQDELLFGPDGEAGKLYRKITGEIIPGGTTGYLNSAIMLFNFLQAAGPDLTPDNLAAGAQSLPAVGDDQLGVWSWQGDHTGREDAREVYWDPDQEPSPAEADRSLRGRWVATDGGRRYLRGEWPDKPPAVFPNR